MPSPQLGSKFTKLANRFASKTNQSVHQNLLPKDDPIIKQVFTLNKTKKLSTGIPKIHTRAETSFEGTQLEYFRITNQQQKDEILKLREELKMINERMNKTVQERKKAEEKLFICHRTTNRS